MIGTQVTFPEMGFIRKFFEAVDAAVTTEMARANVAYEEFLSGVLGRLMDEVSPFQALLSYPLHRLNADLAQCGSGNQLKIGFETNEHAKGYSGSVSHADLGLVFRQLGIGGTPIVEKAIIVECKRLHPTAKGYTLRSRYDSFKEDQFKALQAIQKSHADECVHYFLYNPPISAFESAQRPHLQVKENLLWSSTYGRMTIHPHVIAEFLWYQQQYGRRDSLNPELDREALAMATQHRPGLRVMNISHVGRIVERSGTINPTEFTLEACYQLAENYRTAESIFMPLSQFLVNHMMACHCGSTDSTVMAIASGKKPTATRRPKAPVASADVPETILARHTITITLESTLPPIDGSLLQ